MEAVPPGFLEYGLLGLVLGWFMFRMEKIVGRLIDSADVQTKALLYLSHQIDRCPMREQAQQIGPGHAEDTDRRLGRPNLERWRKGGGGGDDNAD